MEYDLYIDGSFIKPVSFLVTPKKHQIERCIDEYKNEYASDNLLFTTRGIELRRVNRLPTTKARKNNVVRIH